MSTTAPLGPARGLNVVHLFCHPEGVVDVEGVRRAVQDARDVGLQVVTAAIMGAKADTCFMVLGEDLWALRKFQSKIQAAGFHVAESYVSVTEISEYAQGMPEAMLQSRLYPQLPPAGKTAFCFYPMSKRRAVGANWYEQPYEERERLMRAHGTTGRTFSGRVVQLITGSTGLDEFEWGVTLFAQRPDDLKEVVYKMRFDEASAHYADFGPFYAGAVASIDEVLVSVGLGP